MEREIFKKDDYNTNKAKLRAGNFIELLLDWNEGLTEKECVQIRGFGSLVSLPIKLKV